MPKKLLWTALPLIFLSTMAGPSQAQDAVVLEAASSANPTPNLVVQGSPLTWPPVVDSRNTVTKALDGRGIERFLHGPRDTWKYPVEAVWPYPPDKEAGVNQQNSNSFYVVEPKEPREGAPLFVVMHSANRTGFEYLGLGVLGRKTEGNAADPETIITKAPDGFYTLFLNSTNAEWWGGKQIRRDEAYAANKDDLAYGKTAAAAAPAERRVLDTIEWVVQKYKIDRNRIYLAGVSMGGCGALGVGMPNGEIFAAVLAGVPAGTSYANYRMGGFAPSAAAEASKEDRDAWILRCSAVGLPDPPVVVDFSSQKDTWAVTQPALVQAAVAGKLPLILSWGLYGHTSNGSAIAAFPICDVVLAFPWTEIRKNEAYPVFTHASCDEVGPWLNAPAEYDAAGQMNAWFRWKSEEDTASILRMRLWIEHPKLKVMPPNMPKKATADVTLRRLQAFKVEPGKNYAWEVSREGKVLSSGKVAPDAANLLTIPQVEITMGPVELTLKPE